MKLKCETCGEEHELPLECHARDADGAPCGGKVMPTDGRICHVCGDQTPLCCSDCRIDLGVDVHICAKPECRREHDRRCGAELRKDIAELLVVAKQIGELRRERDAVKDCLKITDTLAALSAIERIVYTGAS